MTRQRQEIGQAGEKAARKHLEKIGYKIIQTNYSCCLGEIDIIANDKGVTVIIEVRTKTGTAFGAPEESITAKKGYRLKRLALYYLQSEFRREVPCRIDLIAVVLNKKDYSVSNLSHIRGILSG